MDNPFFKQKEIRDILNSVLYVYARTHSNLGYIQGMNEILAPMVHVLYKDWETTSKALEKEQSNNNNNNSGNNGSCGLTNASTNAEVRAVQAVAQREYIEHDSYRMFLRLMEIIGPLFNSPEASNSSNSSSSSSNNIGYVEIFGRCYEVQRLLAEKDPELAGQLTKLGIQPQLYMLRWVRIMFAQVFPLSDILVFWDAIFALGPPYRLVDHICVTLLLLVRDSIMGHELSDALSVLFHYPEHTAPAALITSLAVNSYFAGWKHSHVFIDSLLPQPHVAMPQFLVARTAHMQSSSSSSNGNGGGGDDYSTTTTTSSSSSSTTKKKKSNKNG